MVLLEKPLVAQLIKKLHTFYEIPKPFTAFTRISVTVAGLAGPDPVRCSRSVVVCPDSSLQDALTKAPFDAIVLPGGLGGARNLAASSEVGLLLQQQEKDGRLVAAICAAPTALQAHNVGFGKSLTSYPSLKEQLQEKYAYKEDSVVVDGRQSVHDEKRSGWPSIITDDLVELVRERIMENRRVTIAELSSHVPQISRSLLHEIVMEHLLFRKLCARWVPKQLTPEHKTKRMESALTFLQRYHDDGDKFLDRIITGNLVTSRGPGTAFDFALAIVDTLLGPGASDPVAKAMLKV
ncbi:Protein DJ-1alpha [Cryptotermes secundus]|uniref:Protein DJ-1alpha n=1 Tax=Cryptotermes secundus TaxID=105785 RepID=A0A2J7RFB6_9NEOP|nr:Protein DJ-1alpha [Cryptotermes secundus]